MVTTNSVEILRSRIKSSKKIFCSGLFLSARWFTVSEIIDNDFHLIVLPNSESAEYCAADLYNLVEGDYVFYLPASGNGIEKSNYKSSLNVQRTSAIQAISSYNGKHPLVIVSFPEALSEPVPAKNRIKDESLALNVGQEISHDQIVHILIEHDFEKVDFVSAPGQFAVRGSLIDIFSYSDNNPYRISFWGDEIESINLFNCNTQLSINKKDTVEIVSSVVSDKGTESIFNIIPGNSLLWLDSSDMYKEEDFYKALSVFKCI